MSRADPATAGPLAPDPETALTFLELLHPGGPWNLTAITPDGPATTETFYKSNAVAAWISRQNKTRNIYLMVAEAAGTLRKKADKDDVARTHLLWADIDGITAGQLNGHAPPPTTIVASGGGLNLYWTLAEPIHDKAAIEAANRWIAKQLGADHCWNCDRILRVAGTVNWPNRKKQNQGRVPVLARCIEHHPDRVYVLGDFGRVEAKEGDRVELDDDIELLALDDLPAEIREKLPRWARRLIRERPGAGEYTDDRSKAVWAVTCALVRADASDDQIAGILLNPDLPIHAHVADQKGHGPRAYVMRQIERARDLVEEDSDKAADEQPADDGGNGLDAELAKLARLGAAAYDKIRRAKAKELGIRADTLDKLVSKLRPADAEDATAPGAGRSLEWPEPDPWPEPVNGADLLDEIAATFSRFVVLPPACGTALSLWALHAHAFEASPITPRLAIVSPEKRCGKTTTLEVVQALTPRALLASNITAAAVFRTIELARPTLLIDEADTFLADAEELRGVLNSGQRRTGEVIRVVGDDFEPRRFSTWAPVAIAAIGKIPGTLEDRSIKIELKRRAPGETVQRWRVDGAHLLGDVVRRCARWAADHHVDLQQADPGVPEQLHDRAADNWRPLLAIADAVGGEWPGRARKAAVTLSAGDDADTRRTMLLGDIKTIFADRGNLHWIKTEEIVEALVEMTERPWATIRKGDRPITAQGLRSLLEPFKVFSSHNDAKTTRGYRLNGFADAWARYLPPDTCEGGIGASIRPEPNSCADSSPDPIRPDEDGLDGCEAAANPHGDCDPDGWTDRTPEDDSGEEIWL